MPFADFSILTTIESCDAGPTSTDQVMTPARNEDASTRGKFLHPVFLIQYTHV